MPAGGRQYWTRRRRRLFAFRVDVVGFQQSHHAFGCARAHQRHFDDQAADIVRVEAVHIFMRLDTLQTAWLSMCAGSGSCTKIPSTAGSPFNSSTSFSKSSCVVQTAAHKSAIRCRFLAGQFFIAYINRASRVVANQYHRQARRVQTFFLTRFYRLCDRLDALLGDFFFRL